MPGPLVRPGAAPDASGPTRGEPETSLRARLPLRGSAVLGAPVRGPLWRRTRTDGKRMPGPRRLPGSTTRAAPGSPSAVPSRGSRPASPRTPHQEAWPPGPSTTRGTEPPLAPTTQRGMGTPPSEPSPPPRPSAGSDREDERLQAASSHTRADSRCVGQGGPTEKENIKEGARFPEKNRARRYFI